MSSLVIGAINEYRQLYVSDFHCGDGGLLTVRQWAFGSYLKLILN